MGLEEHLLTMFREDFEFHDAAGASHHGGKAIARVEDTPAVAALAAAVAASAPAPATVPVVAPSGEVRWLPDAERELKKIPFFVRGVAKRNTERFAAGKGIADITVDTLYEAKAHYAR
jgi:light-independent protochlorophyllide reductase subunit B